MASHSNNRSRRPGGIHNRRQAGVQNPIVIADDWPDNVPVTPAELEAIEIWLKPLLDEIFGGGNA